MLMPTEIQNGMNLTLVNIDCTFVFIDNNLFVSESNKNVHMQRVREVLEDKAILEFKCEMASKG